MVVSELVDSSQDTTPPSWPHGSRLSVSSIGEDYVHLAWPSAEDNKLVAKYNVYQNDVKVTELSSDITRYEIEGLSPHTEYSYKVEAVDAAGNVSPVPLTLSVTTLSAPLAPWPVTSVTASGDDGNIEDNTLDQNLYTRWSAAGDGPWIMYDLGEARDIGYLGIAFYKGNVRATEIDIETSDDGVSWSPLFNGSAAEPPPRCGLLTFRTRVHVT